MLADIEKAFLQVCIDQNDIDSLRILWYDDALQPTRNVRVFRCLWVVFGFVCSPFLLNATIRVHLKRWLEQTVTEEDRCGLKRLLESFHVDDLTLSVPSDNEVEKLVSISVKVMKDAGMSLRKCVTNSSGVYNRLAEKELMQGSFENQEEVKVLGIYYSAVEDMHIIDFSKFVDKLKDCKNLTKRTVLSVVSGVYDPFGLVSPVVVELKILVQELWRKAFGWDNVLPETQAKGFMEIFQEWRQERLTIHRQFVEMKGRYKMNLHVFADASKKACAVECYGQTSVFLIASKTKVCGMKEVEKIPRLELVAALLAARLGKGIGSALGDVVGATHWWSDSVIVLSWIRSHMPHTGQFVQRRLKEIRLLSNTASWHYVSSVSNPADIPSRGMRIKELKNSRLWWQGPEFLRRGKVQWPLDKAEEQLKVTAVATNIEREKTTCVFMVVDCRRYSKYSKLVKVVEQLLHFAELSRKRRFMQRFWEAEKRILASLQQLHFAQELSNLRTFKGKELSRIRELRLFLSGDGLIRCNTRLHEAKFLSYVAKNPILLPASDHLSDLIIQKYHELVKHGSERCTVAALRERFWVIRARQQVRRVLQSCQFCKRSANVGYKVPDEANLPAERLSTSPAFTYIGIDFAGPLYLKYFDQDVGSNKAYICLITCASSRAVHLEVTQTLSVPSFMRAFKRFVARRSTPTVIFSDNGRTFKGASEEVKEFVSFLCQEFAHPGVKWKFSVELAPWFGGFWERLVRSVKEPLRKVLGRQVIAYDELVTTVTEVEAVTEVETSTVFKILGGLFLDNLVTGLSY